jgi:hypothetical protein
MAGVHDARLLINKALPNKEQAIAVGDGVAFPAKSG